MAYYLDHEAQITRDLERRRERAEAIRRELPDPPKELMRRLRAAKERREAPAGGR